MTAEAGNQETHILNHEQEIERAHWEGHEALTTLKAPPSDILPPARTHFLNLHQSATRWGPSVQTSEHRRDSLIHTIILEIKNGLGATNRKVQYHI